MFREQRVKARRNNKEMLKHEIQFMSNYLEGSRVKTSQVAESKSGRAGSISEIDQKSEKCLNAHCRVESGLVVNILIKVISQ